MPHVQITWVEGRTPDQKRKIAERVTRDYCERDCIDWRYWLSRLRRICR